jgi:hypothetical protein
VVYVTLGAVDTAMFDQWEPELKEAEGKKEAAAGGGHAELAQQFAQQSTVLRRTGLLANTADVVPDIVAEAVLASRPRSILYTKHDAQLMRFAHHLLPSELLNALVVGCWLQAPVAAVEGLVAWVSGGAVGANKKMKFERCTIQMFTINASTECLLVGIPSITTMLRLHNCSIPLGCLLPRAFLLHETKNCARHWGIDI